MIAVAETSLDLLKFAQARLDSGNWSGTMFSDGEALFVIPRLRLAVALTAPPTGDPNGWRRYTEDLLTRYVVSAAPQ